MSRSYKHTPIHGITKCSSERYDKQKWHSRMRTVARTNIQQHLREGKLDEFVDIVVLDVSNVWVFGKDGKHYNDSPTEKDMRK